MTQPPTTWIPFAVLAATLFQPAAAGEVPQKALKSTRVGWTTSRFIGSPDPPPAYRADRVFPNLSFERPTVLTSAPGTDRMFIAEQGGKIYSFPPQQGVQQADLLLDVATRLEEIIDPDGPIRGFGSIYGLTFHPDFPEQPYCYVCYVVKSGGQLEDGTRVSRFRIQGMNPPIADPASEQIILTWLEGGHNGGCLKFGPQDGYLYISTGDGGFAFPPDGRNAGQDVSNLLSSVLRIDVDRQEGARAYRIPPDNPFIDLPSARPEIWAYGFRNPWKMSFDRATGDLWVGDVGWELWELVYRVQRGGNYGWSIMEGRQPVHMERARGPTPILPPTLDIPHIDGASITGGFVYRGQQHKSLRGRYIFGDWETRRVWSARLEGKRLVDRQDLTEPTVRLVGFAEDHQGELYLLDHDTGTIHQLVANEVTSANREFPRLLSTSGIFTDVAKRELAPGVVPFSINTPQWSDGARARRFLGVPGQQFILIRPEREKIPGSMFRRQMDFPVGTVLGKTLELPDPTVPHGYRPVETQILHFSGTTWRGYSYAWNDELTDARLVGGGGDDRIYRAAPSGSVGGGGERSWHFSSRAECGRCHNPWSEYTLAFNLAQLNLPASRRSADDHQLERLTELGFIRWSADWYGSGQAEQTVPAGLPQLHDPNDETLDLERRARAYLHVNCAHCHRFNGGGVAYFELLHDLKLEETEALGVRPTQGTFGIHHPQIIAPGDPYRSILLYRMAKLGRGRMPYLGTETVDTRALLMIHDWIRQLPKDPQPSAASPAASGAAGGAAAAARPLPVDSTSAALRSAIALLRGEIPEQQRQQAIEAATSHPDAQVRDLFEQFLPAEQRSQRLGSVIRPEQILALQGDAERGRELFHVTSGVQCKNCHRISGGGPSLGPDLTEIGQKVSRVQLLESILEPSKYVDPKFATYLVETSDGRVVTGLLEERTETVVVLRDAKLNQIRIPSEQVEQLVAQRVSLMPELLLRDLTAQQVADLLAYLLAAGRATESAARGQ